MSFRRGYAWTARTFRGWIFWDLADPLAPKEIEGISIECHNRKPVRQDRQRRHRQRSGRWHVATCDNGLVSVYKSADFPHQSFAFEFDCKPSHSYESFCLLSDTSGTLLRSRFQRIRRGHPRFARRLRRRSGRPCTAAGRASSPDQQRGDWRRCPFRWGVGLEIEADGRVTVMGTKRNFDSIFLDEVDRDRLAHLGRSSGRSSIAASTSTCSSTRTAGGATRPTRGPSAQTLLAPGLSRSRQGSSRRTVRFPQCSGASSHAMSHAAP